MIKSIFSFILLSLMTTGGLVSCVHAWDKEQTIREEQNVQWAKEAQQGKPFTNYGE